MLEFKKILCPTDFSDPSFEGIKTANELGLRFSAEIVLINVVPPIPIFSMPEPNLAPVFDAPAYQSEISKSAEIRLRKLTEERISPEIHSDTRVIVGDPAREIVDFAKTEAVDIIVISTHGFTGWRRLLVGSVTEKVIRRAPCFVLSVPRPPEEPVGD